MILLDSAHCQIRLPEITSFASLPPFRHIPWRSKVVDSTNRTPYLRPIFKLVSWLRLYVPPRPPVHSKWFLAPPPGLVVTKYQDLIYLESLKFSGHSWYAYGFCLGIYLARDICMLPCYDTILYFPSMYSINITLISPSPVSQINILWDQ